MKPSTKRVLDAVIVGPVRDDDEIGSYLVAHLADPDENLAVDGIAERIGDAPTARRQDGDGVELAVAEEPPLRIGTEIARDPAPRPRPAGAASGRTMSGLLNTFDAVLRDTPGRLCDVDQPGHDFCLAFHSHADLWRRRRDRPIQFLWTDPKFCLTPLRRRVYCGFRKDRSKCQFIWTWIDPAELRSIAIVNAARKAWPEQDVVPNSAKEETS